ncbi:MAG: CDP-alcohol phosphatidyltransferase family protein [Chloroflexi bacterium]|nr:CDP-alcohol phosphatidyltransferase family protein [Chloroflexota bacterium]
MSTTEMPATPLVPTGPRARVRQGVQPIARGLGRLGLTPNALTLIGFGIAVVAAWLAAEQAWLAAGILVAFGALFDLFDGALARATGTASKFGAFLDSTFDRAGEAVVYVGIAAGCLAAAFAGGALLATAALAASVMVSYTRAKSESLGYAPGSGMANVGWAPREVRMVILVVGLLLTALGGGTQTPLLYLEGIDLPLGLFFDTILGREWLQVSLGLITLLASFTTIQRIFHVYREAKKQEQQ